MANNNNLQPFTKENAKYYGKKGGINSGIARTEKRSIKEQMKILLDLPISEKEKQKKLLEIGFKEEDINNLALLTYSTFEKALSGDIKATALIFKIMQDEDKERANSWNDSINSLFPI